MSLSESWGTRWIWAKAPPNESSISGFSTLLKGTSAVCGRCPGTYTYYHLHLQTIPGAWTGTFRSSATDWTIIAQLSCILFTMHYGIRWLHDVCYTDRQYLYIKSPTKWCTPYLVHYIGNREWLHFMFGVHLFTVDLFRWQHCFCPFQATVKTQKSKLLSLMSGLLQILWQDMSRTGQSNM